MQAAEPRKLRLLEAGDHAEDVGLPAVLELGLEADHVPERAQRIVLPQLHDGVRLDGWIAGVGKAHRLQRPMAERLAAAGRFAEAIQADFLRLVLQLDARQLVRFHPSRTPNEYVREPALSPDSRRELGELVRRLYAYVFARVPCGADELRDWKARAVPERYARA